MLLIKSEKEIMWYGAAENKRSTTYTELEDRT
jgi:hypothetical protein